MLLVVRYYDIKFTLIAIIHILYRKENLLPNDCTNNYANNNMIIERIMKLNYHDQIVYGTK